MIVACTGHQAFDEPTRRSVSAAIAAELARLPTGRLTGRCNLAAGADQMFAFAVLSAGGDLDAVIPSEHYETTFAAPGDRRTYESLVRLARTVVVMPFPEPTEGAFLAAGQRAVDGCDVLIAVWDGLGPAGRGGTADVVAYARANDVEVRVVWPPGAARA